MAKRKQTQEPSLPPEFLHRQKRMRHLLLAAFWLSLAALIPLIFGLKLPFFLISIFSYGLIGLRYILWLRDCRIYSPRPLYRDFYQHGGGMSGGDILIIFAVIQCIVLIKIMPGLRVTSDLFLLAGLVGMGLCIAAVIRASTKWVRLGFRWSLLLLFSFALSLLLVMQINYAFPIRQQEYPAQVIAMDAWQGRRQNASSSVYLKSDSDKWKIGIPRATFNALEEGDTVIIREYQGPLWMTWREPVWPAESTAETDSQ